MERHSTSEAIVLENRRFGEIHKSVGLFTPDNGLVRATAFGAYSRRGSLRGVTDPFVWGKFYLYSDPVKRSVKITDVEVFDMLYGIREDVARFFTASLWAEIVLRSFGGGEGTVDLYALLREALLLIRDAKEQYTRRVLLQFLLRFLEIAGTPVEPEEVSDPTARRLVRDTVHLPLEPAVDFGVADGVSQTLLRFLVRRVQTVVEMELNTVRTSGGFFGV